MTWRPRQLERATPEVLVALPLLVYAVLILRSGWYPQGDSADIAIKSWDALHGHLPLLGHLTTSSVGGGVASSHPGPIQNYLLAPFLVLSGGHPWGLIVGSSAWMILTLVGCVRLARWRGGAGLASWIAGILVGVELIVGWVLVTPWNPFPAIFCLLLAALATWSLMDGDSRGWIIFVAAGSVAAQGHLSLLLPIAALAAIVVVSFLRGLRPALSVRTVAICAALAVLAWTPVLVDVLVNHPSNPQRLLGVVGDDGIPHLGMWSALSAVTTVMGPGPLDLIATLRLLTDFGSDPNGTFMDTGLLGLLLRPGAWIFVALLGFNQQRVHARADRPRLRRRLTPLLIWSVLSMAAVIASARINIPEGDGGQIRSIYVAFFAPTLLCAPLLLWWSRRRRMHRSLPAFGGRWASYLTFGLVAVVAGCLAPDSAWSGVRESAPAIAAGVRTASAGGACREVALDLTGDLAAVAESTAVFALITQGRNVYVPRFFNRDTDNDFRDLARAPSNACQIRIDGLPRGMTRAIPDGWRVVTVVEQERSSFGAPAGRFVISVRTASLGGATP